MTYDCIIIGGGIAGLQAGIILGRYKRNVVILDAGKGRSHLCKRYNNILGFPDGISGDELLRRGVNQAESFGVKRQEAEVLDIHKGFTVETKKGERFETRTLLFATGIEERMPEIDGILPCLGISVYVCPDCDGYEIIGRKTVVVGSGDVGARMALTLTYWNETIMFLNHGGEALSLEMQGRLREKKVLVQQVNVKKFVHSQGRMQKIVTEGEHEIDVEKVFLAFGGNRPRSEMAVSLGAKTNEEDHLLVNSRSRMTHVNGVWAAGDVVDHTQFVTTAMADGAQSAVWIHKWLSSDERFL